MSASSVLYIAVAFVSFLLKTTVCFVAVSVIARLIRSASQRFALWMAYLAGTALYWISLLVRALDRSPASAAVCSTASSCSDTAIASSTAPAWVIPQSWAVYAGPGLRVLSYLYIAVLAVALLMHIRKRLRLRQILAFAYTPNATLGRFCDRIATSLAIGNYRLLVLPGLPSPATIGWLSPTVLLPAPCEEQNPDELSDVIQHELHHIKRRDYLFERIAHLFRVILFFHPAAWLVCSRLRLEREIACDQAVVRNHPENRVKYAECLVRFARLSSIDKSHVFGVDFAAKSGHLHARIQQVLEIPTGASWWQRSLKGACSVALLAGVIVLLPSLTIALAYAPLHIDTPLLAMKERAKLAISRKTKRTTRSIDTDVQQPSNRVSQPDHAELVPLSVTTPETPTKPHYVLTPAAGTEDENPTVSSAASDQTEIAPLSANPGLGRTGTTGASGQSVTSAVVGAVSQISRMGHGHDKD